MRKIILLMILSMAVNVLAGDVKVEVKFVKKAPFVGLAFMSEDKSLKGKAADSLDQKDKMFTKRLLVVAEGAAVVFKNSDVIDHNIFADDKAASVKFDAGLVAPKTEAKQANAWPEGTVFRVGCKIHPKMRSYVAVVSSAYKSTINFVGKAKTSSLSLSSVPDELTKLIVWFPRYEKIEVEIKVGETKIIEIKKPGKTKVYGTVKLTR